MAAPIITKKLVVILIEYEGKTGGFALEASPMWRVELSNGQVTKQISGSSATEKIKALKLAAHWADFLNCKVQEVEEKEVFSIERTVKDAG